MASIVIMPKQGLQMTEGIINHWFKKEGDKVTEGEPLFEMETDKLSIEIDANASGTLLKIIHPEGSTVEITRAIAIIGNPGEPLPDWEQPDQAKSSAAAVTEAGTAAASAAAAAQPAARPADERVFITPRAKDLAQRSQIDFRAIAGSGPEGLIIEKDVARQAAQASASPAAAVKASPVAARLAGNQGLDLGQIPGSGPGGKVMKADVQNWQGAANEAAAKPPAESIPFSGIRKVIAERMMQSLHGMAQANHRMKVDMTELVKLREQLKASKIKVSYTDILVRIVAKALADFPILNSTLAGDRIILHPSANIGLAVAVDNGLVVPVISGAEKMSLPEIALASTTLIDKAKNNQLKPQDMTGGTFTITNLGMFDIDEFTAVINPPESAILAVGKIDRVPVVIGDEIAIRPIMVLSLTYDHRIIDGAPAARFLQRLKEIIQNPCLLI